MSITNPIPPEATGEIGICSSSEPKPRSHDSKAKRPLHYVNFRCRSALLFGLLAGLCAAPVAAQNTSTSSASDYAGAYGDSYSVLPYTYRGYIGLNLGRTRFDLGCGAGAFSCDDHSNVSANLYTGGMFNDWLGLEVGYLNTGKLDRAGGSTSAQGIDMLLVARVPLGAFNVFAKAGGIYGRTKVTTDSLSGIPSGTKSGGGLSVGAGVGYDFTAHSGVVLEWARNKFKFAAEGHPNVDTTQVGYIYKF